MTAFLVHRSGALRDKKVKLERNVTSVGRKPDNHLVLDQEMVSGHHAEIRRKGHSYYLFDLQSTNGTLVNGRPVESAELHPGDRIDIGESGPVFEFAAGVATTGRAFLEPQSGTWESDMGPIDLSPGETTLGRGRDCGVVVGRCPGSVVSLRHARIILREDTCEIEDLDSSNGTLVNARRVDRAPLHDGDRIEFGIGGPTCRFRWEQSGRRPHKGRLRETDLILKKLEQAAKGGHAGERTLVFLEAANKFYKRRRWPLLLVLGAVVLTALGIGVLYYLKLREHERLRASAEEVFYQMRSIQAELIRQRDTLSPQQFEVLRNERRRQQQAYDEFLKNLGLYEGKTPEQQALMRLARNLGETDLHVPPDFFQTVMSYVDKWRATPRLRTSLDRARSRGLPRIIRAALDQYDLPHEFFLLALQESNFDARVVGPPTRFGIAKGMWQLIPMTARQYQLQLGPLKDEPRYDPMDQRHDEIRSTEAAARYLADLYATKAAASGLLVIACYNYGQTRIIQRLDQLPNDPRERNFWNFYRSGWLPEETRDYVMYILSAALICENPQLYQMNIGPCF